MQAFQATNWVLRSFAVGAQGSGHKHSVWDWRDMDVVKVVMNLFSLRLHRIHPKAFWGFLELIVRCMHCEGAQCGRSCSRTTTSCKDLKHICSKKNLWGGCFSDTGLSRLTCGNANHTKLCGCSFFCGAVSSAWHSRFQRMGHETADWSSKSCGKVS